MEQDLRLDRPMITRQAGMQSLLWGEKFLSGLYATVRSGRIFCHGTRSAPGPPEISPKLVSDTHHIQIHRLCQIIHIGIFYHWLFLCGFTFHLFFF